MFDVFPKALASVASFLFPLFASYKALNTADPAELAPWLMYWVVLSCVVLVESWTEWFLAWVPFYHYFRLFFLLYLVLPQTQGARVVYQTHLHPWLEEHEARIDDFIGSAHERLKTESLAYLRRGLQYIRLQLGLPQEAAAAAAAPSSHQQSDDATYSQSLLARFSLPGARRPGGAENAEASGILPPAASSSSSSSPDYYTLLAKTLTAVGSATGAAGGAAASAFSGVAGGGGTAATYADRANFLETQRRRLRLLLSALDREAAQLQEEREEDDLVPKDYQSDAAGGFEKIDAESGAEYDDDDGSPSVRRRRRTSGGGAPAEGSAGWSAWIWGGGGGEGDAGKSTGASK